MFEDLQLADFGNRIPALSFEVFADGAGSRLVTALAEPCELPVATSMVAGANAILGFAHDGGTLGQVFDLLGRAFPLEADCGPGGLTIASGGGDPATPLFGQAIAWPDGEFGVRTGTRRIDSEPQGADTLRYYDQLRDYQPGIQRATGRAGGDGGRVFELPATLAAEGARVLIDAVGLRARSDSRRLKIRLAALDPAVSPGATVVVAGEGVWRVDGWEWRSGGVELELVRIARPAVSSATGDSGTPWRPADRLPGDTVLAAFELPWDGSGSPDVARIHAAVGAGPGRWAGAALYVERAGALVPVGTSGIARAVIGSLAAPLAPSPALMFEPAAELELICEDPDVEFLSIDPLAFALGANRVLIGDEVLQFMHASPLGAGRWRLSGLLRGRGGSEAEARVSHDQGTPVCLLDERLVQIDGTTIDSATERLGAIGVAEAEPVFSAVRCPGRSRRPPTPVHAVAIPSPSGGGLTLEWTRRARGSWLWQAGVDVPLVEEAERYEVAAGPPLLPLASWPCSAPTLELTPSDLAALPSGTQLWVTQIGSHARSLPLAIGLVP